MSTGNPKHADIMLVVGPVTIKYKEIIKNLYDQMPDPKAVKAGLANLEKHVENVRLFGYTPVWP